MKRNNKLLLLVFILVLSSTIVYGEKVSAKPSNITLILNNKKVDLEAYNIKGNNYFKLRDLGYIFNETDKKFEINWNEKRI